MDLDTINEYCLKKHCVLPDTQIDNIEEICRKHMGLHSARIMTPFMTLCSRMNTFKPEQLISKLYVEKKLIKLRCMRTTLHILPLDMASIMHMATIDIRLADCNLFFKRNNISNESINMFEDLLKDYLTIPQSPEEIEQEIRKHIYFGDNQFRKELAKKILKYYWEKGLLCYVNSADYWEKEERKYALTQMFYPSIDLYLYDSIIAKEMLVMGYIEKFGPATLQDLVWWSGINVSDVKNVIETNINLIKKIEIDNRVFYVLESEYDKLVSYRKKEENWVTLLAYEDPALKGYFETRQRYVNDKNYNSLFNQIGEVRASIIHNGKAIGIWEWDKKSKNIKLEYFSSPEKKVKEQVELQKSKYETILFPNQQLSIFGI